MATHDSTPRALCTLNIGNTHITPVEWSAGGLVLSCGTDGAFKSNARELRRVAGELLSSKKSACPLLVSGVVPRIKTQLLRLLKGGLKRDVYVFRKDILPEIEIVPEPGERVGDDRIAAALGALRLDPNVPWVVADVGTALTCNAVLPAHGGKLPRFEGGLIAPGAALGLKALGRHTAQLPELDAEELAADDFSFIGQNTEEALRWGVALSQVATLLAMIEGQRRLLGPQTRVAITGGGAKAFQEAVRFAAPGPVDFQFHPWLVHLGLFSAWKAFAAKNG